MLTVRSSIALVLGIAALMLGSSMYIASVQLENGSHQADAQERRTDSSRLAESVRATSNDLTRMVRLYATTGKDRYRRYFAQILEIRAGTAPRPIDDSPSFWDRVLAEGTAHVRYGPPKSLVALMRERQFSADEFAALRRALAASDRLARTEQAVIDRVSALDLQPGDPLATKALYPLALRLSDDSYNATKGTIMRAIDRFVALVDARTAARVDELSDRSKRLVIVQIVLLALMALLATTTFAVARRSVVQPLAAVRDATRRVADGETGVRIFRRSRREVRELQETAQAFDTMAAAVEERIARRDEQLADAARAADVEVVPAPPPGIGDPAPTNLRELLSEVAGTAVAGDVAPGTPPVLSFDRGRIAEILGLLLDATGRGPGVAVTVSARALFGARHEVLVDVHAPGTADGDGDLEQSATLALTGRLAELAGGSLAVRRGGLSLTFIATG